MSAFQVTKPEGYQKQPLPFFNEWVEALESANYEQGKGELVVKENNNIRYCCLGVLCQIQGRLTDGKDGGDGAYHCLHYSNPCYPFLGKYGYFPEGIQVKKGTVSDETLASVNDSGKFTFEEIAQVIKEIWKPVE